MSWQLTINTIKKLRFSFAVTVSVPVRAFSIPVFLILSNTLFASDRLLTALWSARASADAGPKACRRMNPKAKGDR